MCWFQKGSICQHKRVKKAKITRRQGIKTEKNTKTLVVFNCSTFQICPDFYSMPQPHRKIAGVGGGVGGGEGDQLQPGHGGAGGSGHGRRRAASPRHPGEPHRPAGGAARPAARARGRGVHQRWLRYKCFVVAVNWRFSRPQPRYWYKLYSGDCCFILYSEAYGAGNEQRLALGEEVKLELEDIQSVYIVECDK